MKKGMTMAMQLLITAIVLVAVAVTMLLLIQLKVVGGPGEVEKGANREACYTNRDLYCQDPLNGCWNSTQALVKKQTCEKVLERSEKRTLYNCWEKRWYSSEEYDKIIAGDIKVTCGAQET